MDKIKLELKSKEYLNHKIISVYLQLILLKLKKCTENNNTKCKSSKNDFYKKFYFVLESSYRDERSATFYAEKLNVEVLGLNNQLLKTTGKTASQLIRDRLLLESKRLLQDYSLSIKEISFLLNFSDVPHFSNFFKNATQSNPSDFRSNLKEYRI